MLHAANVFSIKWGLNFNKKKSQVLIVGQRISNKQWQLGNHFITETTSYKYLGQIINRQLKDSEHIDTYIMEKSKKAYLRYTLAKHMSINRVHFGGTLWQKAILPSISHASGVWFESTGKSRKNISSVQHKIAKAILNL